MVSEIMFHLRNIDLNCVKEYVDYENDYDSTLYPPAIIYDPYDNAKNDLAIEGRHRFEEWVTKWKHAIA